MRMRITCASFTSHASPGHCFQGRYGAKLVDGDTYILRLTRYIHLNPVKVAACEELETEVRLARLSAHRWSSLAGYTDPAFAEPMIDYRWIGEYFGYRGNGAVNKQRQRLRELLADDRLLSRQLVKLEKAMAKS